MALFLPIQPRQAPAQRLAPVSSALSTATSREEGSERGVVVVEEESGEGSRRPQSCATPTPPARTQRDKTGDMSSNQTSCVARKKFVGSSSQPPTRLASQNASSEDWSSWHMVRRIGPRGLA